MRARTPTLLALLPLVALAAAPALAAPAAARPAQEAPVSQASSTPAAPGAVPTVGDGFAHLSADLSGVRVEGRAATEAQAAYDLTTANLSAATATRVGAEAALVALAQRDTELTADIAARTAERKAAVERLAAARRTIRELAVSEYLQGSNLDDLEQAFDIAESTRVGAAQLIGDAARENREAEEAAARRATDAADRAINAAQDERLDVRRQITEQTAVRDQAAADEVRFTGELAVRLFQLEQARATARVASTDFTLVAMDAYWRAAATQPACGIAWWALAGISRVEGRHGTYGGAALEGDGDETRPIIGIALDGTNQTAVIGDTDGGSLDGDPNHDRAVGPMQFIPSTWSRWARDGDGDGDRDPQNIYDAAATAAAYLCAGGPMRTDADLRRGYFSYNQSEAYVNSVLAYAHGYGRYRVPAALPPPPVSPAYP